SPCICWPTFDCRLPTSCLLGASWADFWSCSICLWMSESCDWSPSMSCVETHPAAARAAARNAARRKLRRRQRSRLMSPHVRTAGDDHVHAAVLRPAALRLLGADGALLAIGDGAQAVGPDAQGPEVVLDGVGAA